MATSKARNKRQSTTPSKKKVTKAVSRRAGAYNPREKRKVIALKKNGKTYKVHHMGVSTDSRNGAKMNRYRVVETGQILHVKIEGKAKAKKAAPAKQKQAKKAASPKKKASTPAKKKAAKPAPKKQAAKKAVGDPEKLARKATDAPELLDRPEVDAADDFEDDVDLSELN
jgi:hypothetical protein